MKYFILTTVSIFLLLISCNNNTIGKYKKEPLPEGFSYNIIEDNSNESLQKNELTIEINQKISEGQIATIAEQLFKSKSTQRRFYIFYLLSGMANGSGAWATSHFDPELDIQIYGSTAIQDDNKNKIYNEQVDGVIIGKWNENQYTFSNYIIYKKQNTIIKKTIYKNGQISEDELIVSKVVNGVRYDYKNGAYNGEYFILNNDGNLEFYNSENKNFTIAMKMK